MVTGYSRIFPDSLTRQAAGTASFGCRVLLLWAALVVVLGGSSAFAEQTNGYDGPRWAYLDTKQVMQAAAEITQAKYPDCDDAVVDKKMVRVYRADGTGECQDEAFVKVLTEKGKRNNRSHSEAYQLPYSTAEVVKVEVL